MLFQIAILAGLKSQIQAAAVSRHRAKAIKDFFHTFAAPNSIAIASEIAMANAPFSRLKQGQISVVADKNGSNTNAAGLRISQPRMLRPALSGLKPCSPRSFQPVAWQQPCSTHRHSAFAFSAYQRLNARSCFADGGVGMEPIATSEPRISLRHRAAAYCLAGAICFNGPSRSHRAK